VVRVLGAVEERDHYAIVMELARCDLRAVLDGAQPAYETPRVTWRSLSLRERLRRLLEVVAAVKYLHSQGVVHGDLKPSNVVLNAASGQL